MEQFVRDVVTGSVSGAIYALIAAGLVLTYATTGIFNLGFAGIAFSAAFLFFELNTGLGWPQLIAAGMVILVYCPLLGLVLDVAIFRRLARAPEAAQIVASVGVLLALPALCTFVVGRGISYFDWSIPTGTDVQLVPGLGPQPARCTGCSAAWSSRRTRSSSWSPRRCASRFSRCSCASRRRVCGCAR